MSKEKTRVSLIDGAEEVIVPQELSIGTERLKPIYEAVEVQRQTLEGLETVLVKRLIGFKRKKVQHDKN